MSSEGWEWPASVGVATLIVALILSAWPWGRNAVLDWPMIAELQASIIEAAENLAVIVGTLCGSLCFGLVFGSIAWWFLFRRK